jgi:hypothetical protein
MLNYLRIKGIRKSLTQDATKILVLSLVISHLDYCKAILFGISESELQKLPLTFDNILVLLVQLSGINYLCI